MCGVASFVGETTYIRRALDVSVRACCDSCKAGPFLAFGGVVIYLHTISQSSTRLGVINALPRSTFAARCPRGFSPNLSPQFPTIEARPPPQRVSTSVVSSSSVDRPVPSLRTSSCSSEFLYLAPFAPSGRVFPHPLPPVTRHPSRPKHDHKPLSALLQLPDLALPPSPNGLSRRG